MIDMNLTARNVFARRLNAYCRKSTQGVEQHARDVYQFQHRTITDAEGAEHDQTLFADGFLLLDVSALMDHLTHPADEHGVDFGHWHLESANDFRSTDLARAWDEWTAEDAAHPGEALAPLNTYTYMKDALCQVFGVIGSEADGNRSRCALIDTKLLQLFVFDHNTLLDEDYDLMIAASGRVTIRTPERTILGYVMPFGNGRRNTLDHYGQFPTCPTCGGDGEFHAVPMNEAVTATA